MKLNIDCVKDALNAAGHMPANAVYSFDLFLDQLPDWSREEAELTCRKLSEANLISIPDVNYFSDGEASNEVWGITEDGKELRACLNDKVFCEKIKLSWNKIESEDARAFLNLARDIKDKII